MQEQGWKQEAEEQQKILATLKPVWSQYYEGKDGKLYCHCQRCGKLVRVNKPLFGGLHLCA